MPTYEYECESCAKRFEAVQKMTDMPLTVCPACGEHIRRVLPTDIGIAFHGSGFYSTDAHKKPEKKPEKPAAKKDAPACPAACERCPAAS
ncbi:MAG: zinc ribbon domain-containing protein [Spirochaetaceae bacterium]|jgi:putative FmdB family regulatory protein|nr:zinc ribbon domain-containing protein [Spirochaetaceae bacterium]